MLQICRVARLSLRLYVCLSVKRIAANWLNIRPLSTGWGYKTSPYRNRNISGINQHFFGKLFGCYPNEFNPFYFRHLAHDTNNSGNVTITATYPFIMRVQWMQSHHTSYDIMYIHAYVVAWLRTYLCCISPAATLQQVTGTIRITGRRIHSLIAIKTLCMLHNTVKG